MWFNINTMQEKNNYCYHNENKSRSTGGFCTYLNLQRIEPFFKFTVKAIRTKGKQGAKN